MLKVQLIRLHENQMLLSTELAACHSALCVCVRVRVSVLQKHVNLLFLSVVGTIATLQLLTPC